MTWIPKILITGLPGCGKTTAIIRVVEKLKNIRAVGFYTQEIREGNNRKGFRWTSLDGNSGILAHVDFKGHYWVSKYGINIEEFERLVVPILDAGKTDADLFVIDEIGKMECMSGIFVEEVKRLFISDKKILAGIALKGSGFINRVKDYPSVKLFTLTERNRDSIVDEIVELLTIEK